MRSVRAALIAATLAFAGCADAPADAPAGPTAKDTAPPEDSGSADETGECEAPAHYTDLDGDGFGDPATRSTACDADGVENGDDCDDRDAAVHPDAVEACDGVDNDCNGVADGEDATDASYWFDDADGDTFGDGSTWVRACEAGPGQIALGEDCDDADAAVNPNAVEVCDGIDNNCDGATDGADADGATIWYRDLDRDTFGDDTTTVIACEAPADYIRANGDCDDTDIYVSPDGTESCNGADDDCDGGVDEAGATGESRWYLDADGDGYGTSSAGTQACDTPSGYAGNTRDCDDTDAAVYPSATEYCNGADDDCDGDIDERGSLGARTWFADADGDTYGDATVTSLACDAPSGYVTGSTDCDDADSGVSPGATERCDFGDVDDDCDGLVDEADPDLSGSTSWYADLDLDGYGDATSVVAATCAPSGYVTDTADCDDTDDAVHPGAEEACDAVADANCDGLVGNTDHDGDGAAACEDCDDTDATESPGATELLDGDDDDCDGLVDEYVGDLTLASTAEIDTFCASYASVEGSLDLDRLPSLRALECLRAVSGDLRVSGVMAPDLHGLERLVWVGGSAFFGGDLGGADWLDPSAFTSLDGLDRLAEVGGDFWVADNEVADLAGAPRLTQVGGGVVLYDLPAVDVELSAQSLGEGLWLENLPYLASVSAPALVEMGGGLWFQAVASTSGSFTVDWPVEVPGTLGLVELPTGASGGWTLPDTVGSLWVSENDLADLAGLADLRVVERDLVLTDNAALADLSGLDGLTVVGGDLTISDNSGLTDWSGFAGLESVGGRLRLSGGGPTDASGFAALTSIRDGLSIKSASDLAAITGFTAVATCGDLELYNLPSLTSATGLGGIPFEGDVSVIYLEAIPDLAFLAGSTDLAGSLVVTDNRRLTSFDGLDALESVGAALTVEENLALVDLSMPALQAVTGALSIRDLPVLTNLDLGALHTVGGDVAFENLDVLPDLPGLATLASVGGLYLSQLDTLVDLSGLDALETVEGSLILMYNDNLATLAGLGSLTTVGTDLRLYANASLADLRGLDDLRSVGRDLNVDNNPVLVRPDSLGALQSIGRDLWVESNDSLVDFSGMGSVSLGSSLWVYQNPSLTSLDGLEGLTEVPHHLVLWNLPALPDLGGLGGVESVGGDFRITDCDALVDLSGLDGLESVGESFEIGYQWSWAYGSGNTSLTSLDGLAALRRVGDALVVADHPVLANIDALDGLEAVGGSLYVVDNVSLLTSEVSDLADGTPTVGGSVYIAGNL